MPPEIVYCIFEHLHPHKIREFELISRKLRHVISAMTACPDFIRANLSRHVRSTGDRLSSISDLSAAWALLDAVLFAPAYDADDHVENLIFLFDDATVEFQAKLLERTTSNEDLGSNTPKQRLIEERRAWHASMRGGRKHLVSFKSFNLRADNLSVLKWSHERSFHTLHRAILLRLLQDPLIVPTESPCSTLQTYTLLFFPLTIRTLHLYSLRHCTPFSRTPFTLLLTFIGALTTLSPSHSKIPPYLLVPLKLSLRTPASLHTSIPSIPPKQLPNPSLRIKQSRPPNSLRQKPSPSLLLPHLLNNETVDPNSNNSTPFVHLISRHDERSINLMLSLAGDRMSGAYDLGFRAVKKAMSLMTAPAGWFAPFYLGMRHGVNVQGSAVMTGKEVN
ncbi:hypothetical protein BC829DRAFT_438836 [Chytridium lagenaria]|nr:hypothetical protein BC829DRAFT_438836 [Chytridium lagenaria]